MLSTKLVKAVPSQFSDSKTIPLQIIHKTSGHIRLRVSKVAIEDEYAANLDHLVNSFEWVERAYVNPAARSLVVNYDPQAISTIELQTRLAMALQKAAAPLLPPHCSVELAKRLGVTFQAITWHRSQPDFAKWSSHHDPDNFAWAYDEEEEHYDCCGYGDNGEFETQSKGHKILLALEREATQEASRFVGRLTGQGLGLLLLGSTGAILGENIGAWLGGIVGLEWAAILFV